MVWTAYITQVVVFERKKIKMIVYELRWDMYSRSGRRAGHIRSGLAGYKSRIWIDLGFRFMTNCLVIHVLRVAGNPGLLSSVVAAKPNTFKLKQEHFCN